MRIDNLESAFDGTSLDGIAVGFPYVVLAFSNGNLICLRRGENWSVSSSCRVEGRPVQVEIHGSDLYVATRPMVKERRGEEESREALEHNMLAGRKVASSLHHLKIGEAALELEGSHPLAGGFAVHGDHIYAARSDQLGAWILDPSLGEVGTIGLDKSGKPWHSQVGIYQDRLFLFQRDNHIDWYELNDPLSATWKGELDSDGYFISINREADGFLPWGDLVVCPLGGDTREPSCLIDLRKDTPGIIGMSAELHGEELGKVLDKIEEISEHIAVCAVTRFKVQIADLSEVKSPRITHSFKPPERLKNVVLTDDGACFFAYGSKKRAGVLEMDLSNIEKPKGVSVANLGEALEEYETDSALDLALRNQDTERLDLGNQGLSILPDEMASLTKLTHLRLSDNSFPTLPPVVARLPALVDLDLSSSGLETLSNEIGDLKSLQKFDLSKNKLRALPDRIGDLQALTQLRLQENQLESLPKSFGRLSALRCLYLYRNQLASLPESFGDLGVLEELLLNENKLTALPESIARLGALQELKVPNNPLEALPSLEGLESLTELDLHGCQLTAVPPLGMLAKLEKLDLRGNRLASLPGALGSLGALTHLELAENPLAKLPREIFGLTSLTNLNLANLDLTEVPREISNLENLESLDLSDNKIEHIDPELFSGLASLEYVSLFDNPLSEETCEALEEALEEVDIEF